MKTLLISLLAVVLTSCSTLTELKSNISPAQIQEAVQDASYFGSIEVLASNPENRERLETAVAALDDLIAKKAVTAATFRQLVSTLPVKALKSQKAQLAFTGATMLYDMAVGKVVNLERHEHTLSAAVGMRDGVKKALAESSK